MNRRINRTIYIGALFGVSIEWTDGGLSPPIYSFLGVFFPLLHRFLPLITLHSAPFASARPTPRCAKGTQSLAALPSATFLQETRSSRREKKGEEGRQLQILSRLVSQRELCHRHHRLKEGDGGVEWGAQRKEMEKRGGERDVGRAKVGR